MTTNDQNTTYQSTRTYNDHTTSNTHSSRSESKRSHRSDHSTSWPCRTSDTYDQITASNTIVNTPAGKKWVPTSNTVSHSGNISQLRYLQTPAQKVQETDTRSIIPTGRGITFAQDARRPKSYDKSMYTKTGSNFQSQQRAQKMQIRYQQRLESGRSEEISDGDDSDQQPSKTWNTSAMVYTALGVGSAYFTYTNPLLVGGAVVTLGSLHSGISGYAGSAILGAGSIMSSAFSGAWSMGGSAAGTIRSSLWGGGMTVGDLDSNANPNSRSALSEIVSSRISVV